MDKKQFNPDPNPAVTAEEADMTDPVLLDPNVVIHNDHLATFIGETDPPLLVRLYDDREEPFLDLLLDEYTQLTPFLATRRARLTHLRVLGINGEETTRYELPFTPTLQPSVFYRLVFTPNMAHVIGYLP